MQRQLGFTLVELVTIIILVGVLSVVALPRLFSQSGYSAYTLQDEFISELRKAQLMALNNSDRCYRIAVTGSGYQTLHFAGRTSGSCSGTLERTEALQDFKSGASLQRISSSAVSFNIDFDAMGRINLGCSGDCIRVIADNTLNIAIESEGYIHEG